MTTIFEQRGFVPHENGDILVRWLRDKRAYVTAMSRAERMPLANDFALWFSVADGMEEFASMLSWEEETAQHMSASAVINMVDQLEQCFLPDAAFDSILTVDDARQWIKRMFDARCLFHFDDDPRTIVWDDGRQLPEIAAKMLDHQVNMIMSQDGDWGDDGDPYGYALTLIEAQDAAADASYLDAVTASRYHHLHVDSAKVGRQAARSYHVRSSPDLSDPDRSRGRTPAGRRCYRSLPPDRRQAGGRALHPRPAPSGGRVMPTPRQAEGLFMLYQGKSLWDRDPNRTHDVFARSHASNAGGSVSRMRETMGNNGWLVERETARGRIYFTDKLTSAGLLAMAERYPGLDGFDDRLAEARQREADQAEQESLRAAEARENIRLRADRLAAARNVEFRRIMQEYQVRIDLTDDQCRAIWLAIVEKEMEL